MIDYKEYLNSDYWIKRRKEFKSRNCGRCFICEKKSVSVSVHHKYYYHNGVSILNHEKDEDLLLLCQDCHEKIHEYGLEPRLRQDIDDKTKKDIILKEFERRVKPEEKITIFPPQKSREVYDRKGNLINFKRKESLVSYNPFPSKRRKG